MASNWKSYNDLAWTEDWLADPSELDNEAQAFLKYLAVETDAKKTMLHLGCGAGGYEPVFSKYFNVTGVDISKGMLDLARKRFPDIEYIEEDMRILDMNRQFDVVVIPDAIDYMVTEKDLQQAIKTAVDHLKPGGIFLVVGKTEESYKDNNFVYTGEKDGIHITLFENNFKTDYRPNTYEATIVYLIRENEKLTVHSEQQILGLFPLSTWNKLLSEAGLTFKLDTLDDLYDGYVMEDGEYQLTVFKCRK